MESEIFTLNERGAAVPASNRDEWEDWICDDRNRFIAKTTVPDGKVSTIFLGFYDQGCLFETMILGGPLDGLCHGSRTRDEAILEHDDMVKRAKGV